MCLSLATAMDGPQIGTFRGSVVKRFELNFLVALPESYNAGRKRFPLLVFLHGSGERGTDVNQVAIHGPLKEVAKGRKLPFIIVAPQCPPFSGWDPDYVDTFISHVTKKYRVDADRVYLTGLSMGGYGTWSTAMKNPQRFAAIAPLCGGGMEQDASTLADLPIWVTHGDADLAVPLSESQKMVDAVRAAGNRQIRYTIVKGGGHDIWSDVYGSDDFYTWLLQFTRRDSPIKHV